MIWSWSAEDCPLLLPTSPSLLRRDTRSPSPLSRRSSTAFSAGEADFYTTKGLAVLAGGRAGEAEVLQEGKKSACQFPWCKYSHHGQLPTTRVALTGQESGRDACNLLRNLGRLGKWGPGCPCREKVTFVYLLSPRGASCLIQESRGTWHPHSVPMPGAEPKILNQGHMLSNL